MKAIIFEKYGPPDDLRLGEVEKPAPQEGEVLVKIHAASVNPLDWHIMRGEPFFARIEFGLRKPNINRLGADIAGVVEAVGPNVTEFKVGDAVFGDVSFGNGLGGFAEYVAVKTDLLALKPENLTFEETAITPVVAFTALQGLRDTGNIQAGEKVLINGASGGVGSFAVQLAKHYGAEVTGVSSGRNHEMVRSIGADHMIDYTKEDFTNNGQQYDLIYDAVGNRNMRDMRRALKPNGRCVIAGFTTMSNMLPFMIWGPIRSKFSSQQIGVMPTAHPNKRDLLTIKAFLESGDFKPVIDRCYPLSEVPEAIRYLEPGRVRGKVAIQVV